MVAVVIAIALFSVTFSNGKRPLGTYYFLIRYLCTTFWVPYKDHHHRHCIVSTCTNVLLENVQEPNFITNSTIKLQTLIEILLHYLPSGLKRCVC